MIGNSVRVRLLLGAAAWIALALILAGAAILYMFTADSERHLTNELESSSKRLVASIAPEVPLSVIEDPLSDPGFETPFSGLYWQIAGGKDELRRSRSLGDVVLADAAIGEPLKLATIDGPQGQKLAALSRIVEFPAADGAASYRVTLAADRRVIDSAVADFGSDMATALALVGLALIAAAALQVHLGLRPFAALQRDVEDVRRGGAERLRPGHPAEVLPLVGEVNELLATREKAVEFARARAADLAHGLKTPLSVLAATADRLRDSGDVATADLLSGLTEEMHERIDYQLRLAQLRVRSQSQVLTASLNTALLRTVSVLKKTHRGESLFWNVRFETDVVVNIDRHDLIELVGILLENATKWAETSIDVSAGVKDDMAELCIADDGPGLTTEQIGDLGDRGRRLDESRPGTGLGLSIAIQILDMNGGTIQFSRSDQKGGLQVVLRLPIAKPG